MSARKQRPEPGARVTPGMSLRDVAAAIGTNKTELSRWVRLASVPTEDFEQILEARNRPGIKHGKLTAQKILDLSRGWDKSETKKRRLCPHCGKPT